MFDLTTRAGPHQWKIYDEKHRSCVRCGLRLFWTSGAYGSRGWVLVTGNGVLISNVLGDGFDEWGRCEPPANASVELVVIEYTGDPDNHPGCERFIHRLESEELERGGSGPGLVELGGMWPLCGWRPMFWEIAPARIHHGWTWCGDCFPGKGPTSAECHPSRRRHAADWDPGDMRPRNGNPIGPALGAGDAYKRQLDKAWARRNAALAAGRSSGAGGRPKLPPRKPPELGPAPKKRNR